MEQEENICMVNEKDEVIGSAPRSLVERYGCFWRAAHVWFVTPQGEVIFQVRSMKKKSQPGMWDSTVAGHVSSGEGYLKTALRETKEETGIDVSENDLIFLGKIEPVKIGDRYISRAFRGIYMHIFDGNVFDLKIEDDEGAGFEKMYIEDVLSLDSDSEIGKKIVPAILKRDSLIFLCKALVEVDSRNPVHWMY